MAAEKPSPVDPPAGPVQEPLNVVSFVVRVWNDDHSKRGRRIGIDPGAVPVCEDEQIRVEVALNRRAHIYLLLADGKGAVLPLYPWNVDRLLYRKLTAPPPVREATRTVVSPPEQDEGWRLDDTVGLDTVLMLARQTPLPVEEDLARLLGEVPEAPPGFRGEVLVRGLDRGTEAPELAQQDQERGVKERAKKINDQLLHLMKRLDGHFEVIRAVQFAHVPK
jgi:hypothetical protein